MLGRLGATEVILILAVALLIFGPAKLPQLSRSLGEGIREFKKSVKSMTDDVTPTLQSVKSDLEDAKKI